MAKSDTPDSRARNRSMDVSEISTGSTHWSEQKAQKNPPGPQTPALDPSPPKTKAEETAPPSITGTTVPVAPPETEPKVVSEAAGGEKKSSASHGSRK